MADAPSSTAKASRIAVRAGVATPGSRALPEEVPVALSFGGTTQAVMMATPDDLQDFGVGFALSEAIVRSADDIVSMEIVEADQGFDVQMQLSEDVQTAFSARRRKMAGPVGCGLCGIESIEEALRALPDREDVALAVGADDVREAVRSLSMHQKLRAETGAVHAAGFYVPGRGMACVREDVGRHNALDKLIGAMARAGLKPADGAIIITSRVSVDMVQKAVIAGTGLLIAVSAPTALAVRTAEAAGLTLVGIARDADFEIFTRADRITQGRTSDVA
ncbi:MAG: formate dehydrogenase accessory sulfurtransferase FdhD [Hoeflea sp.]|uniref:formate dehydrogenase accessory sulfurtransferase FdhD n=1 Tax=Hoeflea sp. TaxID=1940281 RepID=UPI001DC867AF|nr:formate dehydrogenase accessory sulfurtransferase FdhD [Hoeflea sp.]MBU4529478.1 formate dehydrogenase accessory sulfurtransferase FdhD [Alphaproteobacteria bacterium]MBU4546597.1 formate dehydrogenase accessory sulfurtransferase FdhD [Alphaproteobacteria bacterium]MBU4550865.1 formate dehydrogenase accessory sulfurtransferase FdhD [Alphaproteobacteria bacterium]MBV1723807.1 formate dehydrogenase accessory sulfurtransferase FdhD [Hoeflea sp.]MBV1763084.1 formate dehydrogenase accessory sulf